LSLFSNPMTDGYMGNFRAAKTFRGGHEVSFVLGALGQEHTEFSRDMSTVWARIGGWIELPLGLFARGDLEYNAGDDLEGGRVNLGVGYRF